MWSLWSQNHCLLVFHHPLSPLSPLLRCVCRTANLVHGVHGPFATPMWHNRGPREILAKTWTQFKHCEKTSCNHHVTSVCQLPGREDEEFKICQPRPCLTVIVVHFSLVKPWCLSCLACVYVHWFHNLDWATQFFKARMFFSVVANLVSISSWMGMNAYV